VKWRSQKGTAAVEFAIILPILILLVFGIIEFGFLFYDKAVITNASREGCRTGIVYRETPVPDSEIRTVVKNYAQNNLFTFGTGTVEDGNIAITNAENPPSSGAYFLTVTVDYQYDFLVLPAFVSGLLGNIRTQTTMKMESSMT
jgi:Flp pilus assembly protein TadG